MQYTHASTPKNISHEKFGLLNSILYPQMHNAKISQSIM